MQIQHCRKGDSNPNRTRKMCMCFAYWWIILCPNVIMRMIKWFNFHWNLLTDKKISRLFFSILSHLSDSVNGIDDVSVRNLPLRSSAKRTLYQVCIFLHFYRPTVPLLANFELFIMSLNTLSRTDTVQYLRPMLETSSGNTVASSSCLY